jgi:hypothetical protein
MGSRGSPARGRHTSAKRAVPRTSTDPTIALRLLNAVASARVGVCLQRLGTAGSPARCWCSRGGTAGGANSATPAAIATGTTGAGRLCLAPARAGLGMREWRMAPSKPPRRSASASNRYARPLRRGGDVTFFWFIL